MSLCEENSLLLENEIEIFDFIDSLKNDDLADVVRSAIAALEREQQIPFPISPLKSQELSKSLREAGNTLYRNGDLKSAIIHYKKALATAPKNSEELLLAYSNISAVMFTIKAYNGCQDNLNAYEVLTMTGVPKIESLTVKLRERRNKSNLDSLNEMNTDLKMQSNEFLRDYMDFDVPRNAEIPCASEDVCVENIDGLKRVVAARDIKAGTIVAIERAYVSTLSPENMFTSCYYCHETNFIHYPCEGCQALFCSKDCMKKCLDEYHHIECQIMGYFAGTDESGNDKVIYKKSVDILTTRAAIKMSLQLGWDELNVVSKDMGYARLLESSVKDAFDASIPASILCYDDRGTVSGKRKWNGNLTVAVIVDCLSRVPGYIPEEEEERKKAIDSLSRIMLHLYMTFNKRIAMRSVSFNLHPREQFSFQMSEGWFSFTSKLAHSCEPNLLVLGLNDQVALVALQRIKDGDELTINYTEHFYRTRIPQEHPTYRQTVLLEDFYIHCECRVCTQKWDSTTHVLANLTPDQQRAFGTLNTLTGGDVGNYFKAAAAALDALTGLNNTTQHYTAYMKFTALLVFCQHHHKLNKTYDG